MAMALPNSRGMGAAKLLAILFVTYILQANGACSSVASVFGDADIASKLGAMIRQFNPREVKTADLPVSRCVGLTFA
jgi:hypothetical protein